MVNIESEAHELRGIIPDVDRHDFYRLDSGIVGAGVAFQTEGKYSLGTFNVIILYPQGYPDVKPDVWVTEPNIDMSCGHVYEKDESRNANICYMGDRNWSPQFTSYDVAAMTKTWIYAYCRWEHTGRWGWNEAGFLDYLLE